MLFSKTNNHSFDCDQNKQRVLRPTPFIYCKLEQRCPKKSEHVNNLRLLTDAKPSEAEVILKTTGYSLIVYIVQLI